MYSVVVWYNKNRSKHTPPNPKQSNLKKGKHVKKEHVKKREKEKKSIFFTIHQNWAVQVPYIAFHSMSSGGRCSMNDFKLS